MAIEEESEHLVNSEKDIALLQDRFFVVEDPTSAPPDLYLVVRRDAEYAATVIARLRDFEYAHLLAKELSRRPGTEI